MEPITKTGSNALGGSVFAKFIKVFTAAFILFLALVWKIPTGVRYYGYGLIREVVKAHTIIGTWGMAKLTSEHFYVKFKPEDRAGAKLALETAEHFYHPVMEDFGFMTDTRIPIIIYTSRDELNKSFGWEANESAIGVYWTGTIRVLAPGVWIDETEPGRIRETFISSGPMAHELTHLVVDYLAGGNYPRWFTEGVAQYEEYKLTGFEFNDPAGSLRQPLYTMKALTDDFDALPNQSLAYRESLAAVRYIVYRCGEEALYDLIKKLGRGLDFGRALEEATGMDEALFELLWQDQVLQVEPEFKEGACPNESEAGNKSCSIN